MRQDFELQLSSILAGCLILTALFRNPSCHCALFNRILFQN
uniref:Uncharacterized protein n=1 Tax=Rhizophora mucronata TaxID=61149 RepID=A0A2P2IH15_RHIMU